MTYTVIKTINGRQYRYLQKTWREGGRMRTKSEYVGPVDGDARRKRGVTGFLQGLVRKSDKVAESEEQIQARIAAEDREYAKQDRINDLLTAPTISIDAIIEIASEQVHSDTTNAEIGADSDKAADSDVGESEGEAGEASPEFSKERYRLAVLLVHQAA